MRKTTVALLFALSTASVAQEPILVATPSQDVTPVVEVLATPEPGDAVIVRLPDGEPAVAVPVPKQSLAEEVRQVAEASAETQRDVAAGRVPLEQATRELEETWDPGAGDVVGTLFWVLSFLFGGFFRPWAMGLVRRYWLEGWPPFGDRVERWLNAVLQLAFFAGAFYLLGGLHDSLPQTLGAWLLAAGVSVAGGSTMKKGK
jgi:hypothetical protein